MTRNEMVLKFIFDKEFYFTTFPRMKMYDYEDFLDYVENILKTNRIENPKNGFSWIEILFTNQLMGGCEVMDKPKFEQLKGYYKLSNGQYIQQQSSWFDDDKDIKRNVRAMKLHMLDPISMIVDVDGYTGEYREEKL